MSVKISLFKKTLIALTALLLPIFITFIYSYRVNKTFLMDSSLNAITGIAEAYEGQVYQFLEMSKRRASDFSSDGLVASLLKRINAGETIAARPLTAHLLKNKLPLDKTIDRIYVIDNSGRVVAATKDAGVNRDFFAEPFFRRGVKRVSVVERRTASGRPELAVAAPIVDRATGASLGVIVNFIEFSEVNKVLSGALNRELGAVSWSKGRLRTMEIYLINKDKYMIGSSISDGMEGLAQTVDTEAVKACLEGQAETSGFYTGYRGTPVAGASMCMPLMKWTLLVEVTENEVMESLGPMKKNAAIGALIVMGVAGLLFIAFFKAIIARLRALSYAAESVARGDYNIKVPVKSNDEIGALADSFNRMAADVRQRETVIRQDEERLHAIIDNSTAVIYLKGLDGRFILVNKQLETILKIGSGEFVGKTDYDIFSAEQASAIRANDMQVIQTGRPREFEETVTLSDGIHDFISVKVPVFDAAGIPYAVCGISTDITERKRMEDELRLLQTISLTLSESRDFTNALALTVRRVCEVTGWAYGEVWVPNPGNTALTYCTGCVFKPGSISQLEKSSKDMSFKPGVGLAGRVWSARKLEWIKDLSVNGDTFPRAEDALREGLNSGVGVPIVSDDMVSAVLVFFTHEAGMREERYVNMLSAVSAQLGAMVGRRLAEEERREAMRRYEELVNNLAVGVYRHTSGMDGRFVEVNRAVVEMLEAGSKEEILRHGLMDFCKDKTRCADLDREFMRRGYIKGAEVELVTPGDKTLWVSLTAIKKEDKDGNVYLDGIMEDISEKRLLEAQLQHSQKLEAVGQLAGGIAHDFNNILTAIIGYASLLQMKKGDDETVNSFAGHILTLSEKASTLTQGLLTFSRKNIMTFQPIDLNGLVARIGKILQRLIGEDIEFRTDLVAGKLVIMADTGQIEQILMNLATNARDAMPSGGVITVTTRAIDIDGEFTAKHGYGTPGAYALLTFEDTGTGMDAMTLKHLFEPFFTTKEVGKGTGLGLAMGYGTIKEHNGFINIYSEPGMGTVVKIYLPIITEERGEAAALTKEPDAAGGNETVLLAEDDAEVRETTKKLLNECGYRVIEASNGEEALARFKENGGAISLVILDMIMPQKGGKETYEEMKLLRPDIKAIFTSGYSEEAMRSKGVEKWALDFISKPASPAEFLRKVREVLDK